MHPYWQKSGSPPTPLQNNLFKSITREPGERLHNDCQPEAKSSKRTQVVLAIKPLKIVFFLHCLNLFVVCDKFWLENSCSFNAGVITEGLSTFDILENIHRSQTYNPHSNQFHQNFLSNYIIDVIAKLFILSSL